MSDSQLTLNFVEYRDCPGFLGYRVGDDGSVWSAWTKVGLGRGTRKVLGTTWRRLKKDIDRRNHKIGYECIRISGPRGRRKIFTHRLVLEAFVGPCPSGMEACHNDGDPSNNRHENLRWDTRKNNQADRVRHGTDGRGEKHPMAKLTADQVRAVRADYDAGLDTLDVIADRRGISRTHVFAIGRRKVWKHLD